MLQNLASPLAAMASNPNATPAPANNVAANTAARLRAVAQNQAGAGNDAFQQSLARAREQREQHEQQQAQRADADAQQQRAHAARQTAQQAAQRRAAERPVAADEQAPGAKAAAGARADAAGRDDAPQAAERRAAARRDSADQTTPSTLLQSQNNPALAPEAQLALRRPAGAHAAQAGTGGAAHGGPAAVGADGRSDARGAAGAAASDVDSSADAASRSPHAAGRRLGDASRDAGDEPRAVGGRAHADERLAAGAASQHGAAADEPGALAALQAASGNAVATPASAGAPREDAPGAALAGAAALLAQPGTPADSAGNTPATAAAPAAYAPFEAHLAAALDSPAFAPALGMQLSTLARDGVHEARLHLNPAEMGPIAVQIAVDGERAHVQFSADAAHTRAVLEASLPQLAAALHANGLTLSGGGVSDGGSRPRGDAFDDARSGTAARAGAAGADEGVVVATPRAVVRRRGLVDLTA